MMGPRAAARAAAMGVVAEATRGGGTQGLVDLEERVDRLMLVVEAMWSLLKENGYTDEQLATHIRSLDEADGKPDGRRIGQPTLCRSCDSKVAPGLARCQFCGAETGHVPGPFDNV